MRGRGPEELEAPGIHAGVPPTYLEPILGTFAPNHHYNQLGECLDHRLQPGTGGALEIASLAQGTSHLIEELQHGLDMVQFC